MGCRFNWLVVFGFYSIFQVLYGRELVFPSAVIVKLNPIVDLDDPKIWAQVRHDHAE